MRVVFLARLFHPHLGGVERHVLGLSNELLKRGHQVTIITEQYEPDLHPRDIVEGIEVFRIPVSRVGEGQKKWVIWSWIWHNRHLLDRADIVHVHDVFYWLYWYKLTHPFKKIFTTFHGWEGIYPIPFKNILHKRLAARLSAGTIAVGNYIGKWYNIKPDFVTYGASSHPRGVKSGKGTPTLLFLGRLDHDTGFTACVEMYRRLKPKINWRLVVAGDGPLRHLVPKDARFLGFVPDPSPHIQKAAFVFTTGYLGILEAFTREKIVLSHWDNPVKRDYLLSHPMAKYLVFDDNLPARLPLPPYKWAKSQTWSKLAGLYLNLWAK